jgi:hypothetical protein
MITSNEADIGLMTFPVAHAKNLEEQSSTGSIVLITTHEFALCIIAPENEVEGREQLPIDWLQGKHIVTYGEGTAAREALASLAEDHQRTDCSFHGVDDTLAVNAMVQAGVAYGIAIGKKERYKVGPGIVGVPIKPLEIWASCVAVSRDMHEQGDLAKKVFEYLVEKDREEEPGWLVERPSQWLSERHRQLISTWCKELGIPELELVTRSLDLFDVALSEQKEGNLLTITRSKEECSYPVDLHLPRHQGRKVAGFDKRSVDVADQESVASAAGG